MLTRHRSNRRGAALLLAISMMMLLALLGSTFMFVTRSYRQYSEIIESRGPVELLAVGIVNILSKEMQRDMWGPPLGSADQDGFPYKTILDKTPRFDSGGKPVSRIVRRRFGDYAQPQEDDRFYGEDFWLSTFNVREAQSHASNLGLGSVPLITALVDNKDPSWTLPGSNTPIPQSLMDAKTGGWLNKSNNPGIDAAWQNTYVLNSMGHTYYVAPRVIDLCGLLNVNTAGVSPDPDSPPSFITPVDIDINTVISGTRKRIENQRESQVESASGRAFFFWNVASRLHTPGDGKPFGIGDEIAARVPLSADAGLRLAQMLNGIGDYNRTLVTTYSSNRNFLRRNRGEARQRINPNIRYLSQFYPNIQALDSLDINNLAVREGLYLQLIEAIGQTNEARKKAHHLVANLWAYCDNMNPDRPDNYAFTVDGKTAYGVVPRPVIAEAYIRHCKDTMADPDQDNSYQAYAVEIFNPTDAPVDLSEYTLGGIRLSGTLGVRQRKVFYSHQYGEQAAAHKKDLAKIFESVSQVGWIPLEGLDFSNGGSLKLKKGDIPIDAVKTSDFVNYKKKAEGAYGPRAIQRDDSWDDPDTLDKFEGRERYNVAIWATRSAGANKTANRLGKPNNVGHGPLPLSECVEGFNIVKKRKVSVGGEIYYVCPSVGELCHLFATGPVKGGNSLPEELDTKRMSSNTGLLLVRKSDHRGKAVPTSDHHFGSADYCTGISWPGILAEFVDVVPPDPTRNISHIAGKDVYAVQYGKINVNTASAEVLEALPYPSGQFRFGVGSDETARAFDGGNSTEDSNALAFKIKKRAVDLGGLKTPGQAMVDVRSAIKQLVVDNRRDRIGYVHAFARFGPIIDVLTINSDSFAVVLNIAATTDGKKPNDADPDKATNAVGSWRYLAVIDRSNCMNATDSPQIMLFMPLPD